MFGSEKQNVTLADILQSVGLKAVALAYLYLGLMHWAQLIGFSGGGFVDLSMSLRIYHLGLAIFLPILAFGLWAGAGWAIALWGATLFSSFLLIELTDLPINRHWQLLLLALFTLYISWRFLRKRFS